VSPAAGPTGRLPSAMWAGGGGATAGEAAGAEGLLLLVWREGEVSGLSSRGSV
jgi:hypothetical protein